MNREEFLSRPAFAETQRFIVIRDLRDTLVSRYFSLRGVHPEDPGGRVAAVRRELQGLSEEEGMRWTIQEKGMLVTGEIQRSWTGSGEEVLRYEDLITDDVNQFRRLFLEKLKLPISQAQLERAVLENRFERKYGRKLGEEDASSHGRKGTPGDWRNHFTPALAEEFDATYGEILLATGSETDPDWARKVQAPGVA
jgi:lipopolysaccharide transport system ATP-binding protein